MEKFRAVAIISAFNEADIIQPVLEHLIREGLSVYLLDHGSTDGTVVVAQKFLGRGLLTIEPFPPAESGADRDTFAWAPILRRKTELSEQLDADWFIHHDADEFRESPWEGMRLVDAIRKVDRLGYNAIDFELFDFWPTDDRFQPGDDPRTAFRFYEPGRPWNKLQIKCWKRQTVAPDLLRNGGHEVFFPGRRVFPLRFILRHYPIRSSAHGVRKVFQERIARFAPEEIAAGWHRQYDDIVQAPRFVRSPETLTEYDGDAIRVALILRHRVVEDLEAAAAEMAPRIEDRERTIADLRGQAARASGQLEQRAAEIDRLARELAARDVAVEDRNRALQVQAAEIARLGSELRARDVELEKRLSEAGALTTALDAQHSIVKRLLSDIEILRRELAALYASRTWRWSAPVRAVYRFAAVRMGRH